MCCNMLWLHQDTAYVAESICSAYSYTLGNITLLLLAHCPPHTQCSHLTLMLLTLALALALVSLTCVALPALGAAD